LIRTIKIEGFRSLKSAHLELRRLNVLIGPNQAGKTNLLDALELLKQAAGRRLESAINRTRGGLTNFLWAGRGRPDLKFEVCFSHDSPSNEPFESLSYDFAIFDGHPKYYIISESVKAFFDGNNKLLYEFPDYLYDELTEGPCEFDPSELKPCGQR